MSDNAPQPVPAPSTAQKMHANEQAIDVALVRRLIASQFPQWAHLDLTPVASAGTDNALYRLGDELVVRLPRVQSAVAQVGKEQRWLPQLAAALPIAIPAPLAKGAPAEGFPWAWSVYRWLPGDNARAAPVTDKREAARTLAAFLRALRQIDPTGGPEPGAHNSGRGVPLATRDGGVRRALEALRTDLDSRTLEAAATEWRAAIDASVWDRPGMWIHGDLHGGNMLVDGGRLSAVIDWGCLGVGDPACDLMVAWTFLDARAREVFRAALDVDDAAWARSRGWALSMALIALPYYRDTNPGLVAISNDILREVLGERA